VKLAAHELALAADGDALSRARRFTADALADLPPDLVADAELIVTELVTNALLHAAPPVLLRVKRRRQGARIEVQDDGGRPPLRIRDAGDAMTGRGLALVAALSRSWGADQQVDGGKVVWAELSSKTTLPTTPSPAIDLDGVLSSWETTPSADHLYTVELGDVPTDLLLQAKSHVDSLVREFVLASSEVGPKALSASQPGLGALVQSVVHDFAAARTQIKEQALVSAARGTRVTHLTLHLPGTAAEAGQRYLAALDEADRYARAEHLLTLEAPPLHKAFRRWYVESLVAQLRSAVAGRPPTRPRPFIVDLTA
jgi:anti-sigma regulatory factor (Ser/Thr protein kinase)